MTSVVQAAEWLIEGLKANPNHDPKSGQFSRGGGGSSQSFASEADGKKFLDAHYGEWRKGLSSSEDKALTFYQSPGFALMNGELRGTKVNASASDKKRAAEAVKGMDSQIKSAPPLTSPLTVHRGFAAAQFGKLKVGQIISDKGFVSTATTRDGAGVYGGGRASLHGVINLPTGTKATAGRVKELVLPRGSSFRVTSVSDQNIGLELIL